MSSSGEGENYVELNQADLNYARIHVGMAPPAFRQTDS